MDSSAERRTTRRFFMNLPIAVRTNGSSESNEYAAETRDVSFRGLYFVADHDFDIGSHIDFVLTLPKEITLATDVHIRCEGQIVRTEAQKGRTGMAARIERYEFMPKN